MRYLKTEGNRAIELRKDNYIILNNAVVEPGRKTNRRLERGFQERKGLRDSGSQKLYIGGLK